MATTPISQQRFTTLEFIDTLADPYLDEQTVVSYYNDLYKDVDVQLDEATQYNDQLASVRRKIAITKESLKEEEVQTLRQALFNALKVKEQGLTELAEKEEHQSFPTLGFAESLESVSHTVYTLYAQKKAKNRAFIEKLVDRYSSKLHLTPTQKKLFREKFIDQVAIRERESNYRPLDPELYVKEADAVVFAVIPPEDRALYAKNKATLIKQQLEDQHERQREDLTQSSDTVYSREATRKPAPIIDTPLVQEQMFVKGIFVDKSDTSLETAYESLVLSSHEEEVYRELQRTIIAQEKVPVHAVPFVAIEAATAIIAKEKPRLPAIQIIEEAQEQARAFVANQGIVSEITPKELASTIKEIINEREGLPGRQISEDVLRKFESAPNGAELLQQRQRWYLQDNLATLADYLNKHIDDNEFLKKAFGDTVNHPFFIELTTKLKTQASNNPNSMSGLLSVASGGTKILSDAAGSVAPAGTATPPVPTVPPLSLEKNPAFHFVLTNERLFELSKQNKPMYDRLMKIIPKEKGGLPLPENGMQALFALAVISHNPKTPSDMFDIKHFHTLLGSKLSGKDQNHPDYKLYSYLGELLKFQETYKNKPEGYRTFSEAMVSKIYLTYLFSKQPDVTGGSLRITFRNFLGRAFYFSPYSRISRAVQGLSIGSKLGSIGANSVALRAGGTVLRIASKANPLILAGSLFVNVTNGLWRTLSGVIGLGNGGGEKKNWGAIASVVAVVPLLLLLMGNTSDIKRLNTPVVIENGENYQGIAAGESVDCAANPNHPACTFVPCDSSASDCTLPLQCAQLTQRPGGGFSHAGYNAVDMGWAGCGCPAVLGTPYPSVTATHDGRVIRVVSNFPIDSGCTHAGCPLVFGNFVVIQSTDRRGGRLYQTIYGHLATTAVTEGQTVTRGAVIGTADNTGYSSGPHLHYEIRYGSEDTGRMYGPANPTTPENNILSSLPPTQGGCWRR